MGFDHSQAPREDQVAAVQHLSAANLEAEGLSHGFFLRTGGVSEGIHASLNCGRGSMDNKDRVEENRARVATGLGTRAELLIGPRQVHSASAIIATAAWKPADAPAADAVVTTVRGLAIGVLTADCAPVLMADAQAGVIAAVHAGWKGAKAGVIESAIGAMESLGARPERITASIGPTISQAAYEVGPEFVAAFLEGGGASRKYFAQEAGSRPHFNLPAYVKDRLLRLGVANIHDTGACTYGNESNFFSYRRSVHRTEPDYGRQISAILLV
jgi:polyphenol oxidase